MISRLIATRVSPEVAKPESVERRAVLGLELTSWIARGRYKWEAPILLYEMYFRWLLRSTVLKNAGEMKRPLTEV
jgi:hypothetical protein